MYVNTNLLFITLYIGLNISFNALADEEIKSPDAIPGTTKVNAEGLIEKADMLSELIIIDSRITVDRQQGYIPDSISLPDEETDCKSLANIIPDKKTSTLYYCNGPKCGRSAKAIEIALDCGYVNIYWFRGGYEEWEKKSYPVEKK